MDSIGFEALQQGIKFKTRSVRKDVAKVVEENTEKMYRRAKADAHFGRYPLKNPKKKSTGYLRKNIRMQIRDGGLTGVTGTTAEYGGYVEKGTRFMRAQPFVKPGFEEISKEFYEDLKKFTE